MPRLQNRAVSINFKLDERLHRSVLREAKKQGRSVSELVRDAVTRALDVCPACGSKHGSPRKVSA